jgi:hypothetical protein
MSLSEKLVRLFTRLESEHVGEVNEIHLRDRSNPGTSSFPLRDLLGWYLGRVSASHQYTNSLTTRMKDPTHFSDQV